MMKNFVDLNLWWKAAIFGFMTSHSPNMQKHYMQAGKAQMSLHIGTMWPESKVTAHTQKVGT